jgi:hypothetical protein
MIARLRNFGQSTINRTHGYVREHRRVVIIGACMFLAVGALIGWAVYAPRAGLVWADWTGFGSYVDADGKLQRGKTLWERLVSIKARYDPISLFHLNQNSPR